MPWRPIVTDEARCAQIRGVLAEIAAGVAAHPARRLDEWLDRALLRAMLAADDVVPDPDGDGDAALNEAVARVHTGGVALFGGLARLGWTIAHVAGGDVVDEACAGIDAELAARLPGTADYDLISGLVGFGVYALERGEAGRALATAVLGELERRAQPRAGGLAWHTPSEVLVAPQREAMPGGYWNLGLSHGAPGAVALLARFAAAGIEPARSRALLEAAVAHLLAAAPPPPPGRGRFPAWQASEGSELAPSASPRLAWCYGDLGVAAALLGAGLLAGEPAWRAEGLALARACAARTEAEAAIHDAGLCHGAAGIAHLLNRMAQATGDAALEEAARAWIDRALALRRGDGIAGFPAARTEGGATSFTADAAALTGAPGVALALHAAISEVEPAWDRLLLVDLPAL